MVPPGAWILLASIPVLGDTFNLGNGTNELSDTVSPGGTVSLLTVNRRFYLAAIVACKTQLLTINDSSSHGMVTSDCYSSITLSIFQYGEPRGLVCLFLDSQSRSYPLPPNKPKYLLGSGD
jgi:hypothetical protein